jgi:hypothetical protein
VWITFPKMAQVNVIRNKVSEVDHGNGCNFIFKRFDSVLGDYHQDRIWEFLHLPFANLLTIMCYYSNLLLQHLP